MFYQEAWMYNHVCTWLPVVLQFVQMLKGSKDFSEPIDWDEFLHMVATLQILQ
jgi:hypothetical protein